MPVIGRWLPVAAPLAYLAALFIFPARGWEFTHQRSAAVAFSAAWTAVALWIALTKRRHILASHLRAASRTYLIAVAGVVAVLGVLSYAGYASGSWIPLLLLLIHLSLSEEQPRLRLTATMLGILLPALVLEAGLVYVRSSPPMVRHPVFGRLADGLYRQDWIVVQYHRECAQYDSELYYTLRPGRCSFENSEFRTELRINSLGVRDSEDALDAPDVIVAGDSYSLGWGVEQHETYAKQLEALTRLKVLNAGVGSYATARELSLIERIDRSRLRYLLIQYCINDWPENRSFAASGKLSRHSPGAYQDTASLFEAARRYYPGKYVTFIASEVLSRGVRAVRATLDGGRRSSTQSDPREREMSDLLQVIETHSLDLSKVEILLYEINGRNARRPWLAPMLHDLLGQRAGRRHMDRIRVVDVMDGLADDNYWVLDPHLNAQGHRKIAERLASILAEPSIAAGSQ